ncbi:FAD-binding Berberine family protein [Hibiscus syriacus]|uniref:FAD-binding Berberine family protein n=1 Tax=Hibiscus syriacus TaxID=106335 RepID=A0A6A3D0V6_HIBSY|nr:FAD-binding Berberine family protein [Hibiscus syriacus]
MAEHRRSSDTRTVSSLPFLHSNDSSSISKLIYTRNDRPYSSVLESSIQNLRFNTAATPKPLLIVTPSDASHIQATIHCSKMNGLQVRTRSGGHDFEGLSYVSEAPLFSLIWLISDWSHDVENCVAWVQSGATVAAEATVHSSEKYGLAVDNVIDAHVIDANGRILDRKSMGEDLFWAIRGGAGGNFGIVSEWKLKLVPVPPTVTFFYVTKTMEQRTAQLIQQWQFIAHKSPKI